MALGGIKLETLVSEPDALTITRNLCCVRKLYSETHNIKTSN